MKERTSQIIVGILFFGGLFILAYYTILLKDEFFDTRKYYTVKVEFAHASGIEKNDPVKVLGVFSGTVEDVSLNGNSVMMTLRMFNEFPLYENYVVKVKSEGFMGTKYVEVRPGTAFDEDRTYKEIAMTGVLTGAPSGDLVGALEDLLADNKDALNESVENIRVITGSARNLTAKLNLVADRVARGEGTVGKLIMDDSIANNVDTTVKNLKDYSEDAREQAPITSFIRAALMAF